MGVRKKGRTKFAYAGRVFVWWVDNDTYIRIASEDKSFVVAYLIYDLPADVGGLLTVHGPEFVGITATEPRPVWLIVPGDVNNKLSDSMGALVNALLMWCFDPDGIRERYTGHL